MVCRSKLKMIILTFVFVLDDSWISHVEYSIMLFKFFILFLLNLSSIHSKQLINYGCEFNSTTYPVKTRCVDEQIDLIFFVFFFNFNLSKIDTEWTLAQSCQTCKCLSNKIIICRNQTCQMPNDCPMVRKKVNWKLSKLENLFF